MSANDIRTAAHEAGIRGDADAMVQICLAHGFVVQNPKSKRNIGRVPVMTIMQAYAAGIRARLAA